MAAKYAHCTRWALVYIHEAHAADQWAMGQPIPIPQAKTLSMRAAACAQTQRSLDTKLPFFVDAVTKGCGKPEHGERCGGRNFERVYAAWPARVYALLPKPDGTAEVVFQGMPDGSDFDMKEIVEFLDAWEKKWKASPAAAAA